MLAVLIGQRDAATRLSWLVIGTIGVSVENRSDSKRFFPVQKIVETR